MSTVFIALQANEETRPIIEAIDAELRRPFDLAADLPIRARISRPASETPG